MFWDGEKCVIGKPLGYLCCGGHPPFNLDEGSEDEGQVPVRIRVDLMILGREASATRCSEEEDK